MKKSISTILSLVFVSLLLSAGQANSQVVIYKLDFKKAGTSINFSFFKEGLLVVPALGGTGSLILFDQSGGDRQYVLSQNSARMFVAIKNKNTRKAVFSAFANTGATEAFYMALGSLTETIHAYDATSEFTTKVAGKLEGQVQVAGDESDLSSIAEDGSIGFAGTVKMKAALQKERTNRANEQGQDVSEAVADLIDYLENHGFSDAEAPVPTTATTTTATTTTAATGNWAKEKSAEKEKQRFSLLGTVFYE